MKQARLADKIRGVLDEMSPQLRSAGRFVLDRPREVALLSMRDQARQAGVQPATMTRFAKRLGLDGYEVVRAAYANALRGDEPGFSARAGQQVAGQKLRGEPALAVDLVSSVGRQIVGLTRSDSLAVLISAAESLATARKIYCLGLRSSHPVAWHVQYVLSLLGKDTVMVDAVASTGSDQLRYSAKADVLLVVSVKPYTRATVRIANYVASRNIPILAITDSNASPLAKIARTSIVVGTESASFFHTMVPAFVVAELLVALVAGRLGRKGLEALELAEQQFDALDIHVKPAKSGRAK